MTVTDRFPPEDIRDRVGSIILGVAQAALENWSEGYWADFTGVSKGDVLKMFAGFIDSVVEAELEGDDEPLMDAERTVDGVVYRVAWVNGWDIWRGDDLLTAHDPLDGYPADDDIRVMRDGYDAEQIHYPVGES